MARTTRPVLPRRAVVRTILLLVVALAAGAGAVAWLPGVDGQVDDTLISQAGRGIGAPDPEFLLVSVGEHVTQAETLPRLAAARPRAIVVLDDDGLLGGTTAVAPAADGPGPLYEPTRHVRGRAPGTTSAALRGLLPTGVPLVLHPAPNTSGHPLRAGAPLWVPRSEAPAKPWDACVLPPGAVALRGPAPAGPLAGARAAVPDAEALPYGGIERNLLVPSDPEIAPVFVSRTLAGMLGRPLPAALDRTLVAWSRPRRTRDLTIERRGDLCSIDPARVRGRIVLVGRSDADAGGYPGSFITEVEAPGRLLFVRPADAQRDILATVLGGARRRRVLTPVGAALLALTAALLVGLLATLGARRALIWTPVLAGVWAALNLRILHAPVVLPVRTPALAMGLALPVTLATDALWWLAEGRRLRRLAGRYVPDHVLAETLAAGIDPRRVGRELEATMLFCDLRGFTDVAAGLSAEAVFDGLNVYLDEVSTAVVEAGGTPLSYQGDGLLAAFGAPVPSGDHAARALDAARALLDGGLPRFAAWQAEHAPAAAPVRVGIGIATGRVLSGNVGSTRRIEYAVVGDATNLAAKLQQATRATGHRVLLTAATAAAAGERPDLAGAGVVHVGGEQRAVEVLTLVAAGGEDDAPLPLVV